jgi:hypothetical protein
MRRLIVLGWLSSLVGPTVGGAQSASGDVASQLTLVERAFRAADARALSRLTSPTIRVRVDVRNDRATRGSYGPGQFEAVMAGLFAEHETLAFAFRLDSVKVYEQTAFARADWVQRARDRSGDLAYRLTFTLTRDDSAWRLVEMRSSP